jgi:serine protease inhibitor
LVIPGMALVLSACEGDPSGPPSEIKSLPRQLTVAETHVIQASNAFSFDLLKQVRAIESDPNVFLSPFSASMSLGMTMNGAAGRTFDEMRSTLRFGELSQQEINESYRGVMQMLLGLDKSVEISIANSTWARKGIAFQPAFTSAVQQWFDADTRVLDFALPTAKDTINAWVNAETRNRIPTIIDGISDELMFLINAMYFKGNWTTQFEKSRTSPASFRLDNGNTVQVQMMSSSRVKMRMGYHNAVQIAELPYGGQAFNLVIVLPPSNVKLADFVSTLNAATWDQYMATLQPVAKGEVALPRFGLEYEKVLNSSLKALGMIDAFDEFRADLSRLSTVPSFISFVKQKTFLKVDEEGTEAAAVTVTGVQLTSAPPGIRVDRPFVMAIRERLSGTIIFLGAIGHPQE